MRGYTQRILGTAVAITVGLVLLAGCGSDPAPELSGIDADGNSSVGGSGNGGTPAPGSSDGATPGATTGSGGTGEGGSDAPPATGTKPCAIVTVQDASTALGTTANNTTDSNEECLYEAGDNAVMLAVRLETYDAAAVNEITQLGDAVTKLDGIGDAAFKISLGPETQFHVWIKGMYIVVVVTKESGETDGPARTLLDKILAKV